MTVILDNVSSVAEMSRIRAQGTRSSISFDKSEHLMKIGITLLITLLAWRTWCFVISPWLYPRYPRQFPYWIPFVGHAFAFFRDSNGLLARARQHFDDENEPFGIMVLGMTFYVVTHPKDSADVYRNTETMSFESFVKTLMRANGNSEAIIERMYSALPVDKPGFPNPLGESLGALAQKMHVHQLQPGQKLVVLQEKAKAWINNTMNLKELHHRFKQTQPSPGDRTSLVVPLYMWCSEYFVRLGQHLYFGDLLDDLDPLLSEEYHKFDELIWKMLYQYPNAISKDMSTARSRVISSLKKFFEIPQSRRRGGSAWLINAWEDEARAIGVDDSDLAVLMFFLKFAINTNSRKTAFWLLTYLLYHPTLMEEFRKETGPAFDGTDLVDPFYFQDPEKCPQVDHIWNETLRMTGWSVSIRSVMQDTIIGGKTMCKGSRVMVPHRLLHFDENVFGKNPEEFQPERWSKPAMARHPSWKPFGAGKTLCSGRFLARFAVTTFVATLLRRFDVQMLGSSKFPEADKGRPVLGIVSIKSGQDFRVVLSERVKVDS